MKKILTMMMVFAILIGGNSIESFAEETAGGEAYIAQGNLSEDEMAEIFSEGYNSIISYNDESANKNSILGENTFYSSAVAPISTTYSITTCTKMRKRDYDWIGYSKDDFRGTWTSISIGGAQYTLSLSLFGFGVSFPVDMETSNSTKTYTLLPDEQQAVASGQSFSCLRFKGYTTYAEYSTKVYEYGNLINSFTWNHTYIYNNNKEAGDLNYFAEARTSAQCNNIVNNGYVGTDLEKSNMKPWRIVSNPATDSISPWL